jgi:hypothetical protein
VSRGIVVQEQDPSGDLPHVQIFMKDGPDPLTWDTQLLSYWFSWYLVVFQDSFLWHREVSRAKDLSAVPRNIARLSEHILLEEYTQNAFAVTANDSVQPFKPLVQKRAIWFSINQQQVTSLQPHVSAKYFVKPHDEYKDTDKFYRSWH